MNSTRTNWLVVLLLATLTSVVFWRAIGNDFVFDDRIYMLSQSPRSIDLKGAFTSTDLSLYAPLGRLSLMLDHQLFGSNPLGYHVTNLLIHAANSILIFIVLLTLTGATGKSAVVAALCAVHPLRVEPAAWISGRADLLSSMFAFLALLAWARYLKQRRKAWSALAVGAFLLGMLSKSIIMMLPIVLLLLDYWPLRRLSDCTRTERGQTHDALQRHSRGFAMLLIEKAWLLVVTAAMIGISLAALKDNPMAAPLEKHSLEARAATSVVSYATYLWKTFWPANLTVFYPHRWGNYAWWELGGAAVLLLAVSSVAILAARRKPYVTLGWFWFLGTLLPMIGLAQVRSYPVADRYVYFPQIGLFVSAVWGLADLAVGRPLRRKVAAVAAGALILVCVSMSRMQVGQWKDDHTLYSHAIAVTKDNWMARNNLSSVLLRIGQPGEALIHAREAVRLRPGFAYAHANLGNALAAMGKHAEAVESFRAAIRLPLVDENIRAAARFRHNLGISLAALGRHEEAVASFRDAIRLQPGNAAVWNVLGVSLEALGQRELAASSFHESRRLKQRLGGAREQPDGM